MNSITYASIPLITTKENRTVTKRENSYQTENDVIYISEHTFTHPVSALDNTRHLTFILNKRNNIKIAITLLFLRIGNEWMDVLTSFTN